MAATTTNTTENQEKAASKSTKTAAQPSPDSRVAIIVRPENQRPKREGPIRITYLEGAAEGKSKPNDPRFAGSFLAAGTQFIKYSEYVNLKAQPVWANLLLSNVIEVVSLPTAESSDESTGFTKDYGVAEAYRLISASNDKGWLKDCAAREPRKDVNRAIQMRVREIEEMENPNQEDT